MFESQLGKSLSPSVSAFCHQKPPLWHDTNVDLDRLAAKWLLQQFPPVAWRISWFFGRPTHCFEIVGKYFEQWKKYVKIKILYIGIFCKHHACTMIKIRGAVRKILISNSVPMGKFPSLLRITEREPGMLGSSTSFENSSGEECNHR